MPYETKEELLKLGEMDPELDALLKSMDIPPVDFSDINIAKAVSEERTKVGMKALGEPPAEIKRSDHQYIASDGTKIRARLFQPTNPPKGGSPLIVMYHGGGFCIGSLESEEQTCRNFVQAFGAVCVSAAYRLAPEFPFPYAITDSWDALRWAAGNAKSFGADPSIGFVVGGTSAGGNIAAVLTHMARDEGLSPPLTGQYLSIPAIVPDAVLPTKYKHLSYSYEQNQNAPILPQATVDMFTGSYKPDHNDPRFAVLNDPKGHGDLPPAYFQITGLDTLRDEALIYEKVLREEYGIKTKIHMYPGLPHAFWAFFPMLKSSSQFREDMVVGMGWLLGKKPDVSKIALEAKAAVA